MYILRPWKQPWELGKKYDSIFILTFAVVKFRYDDIAMAKFFENYCKRNYRKMCGLFILQNIEMESEHNTKLFYKNVWRTCGNINCFNTCELNKSMHDSIKDVLCLLFFKDKRYGEKQVG